MITKFKEFPLYQDIISKIRGLNPRFDAMFEKYNKLDAGIQRIQCSEERGYSMKVAKMKLEKLELKRDMLKILEKESRNEAVCVPDLDLIYECGESRAVKRD
ncbi:DUF465 domain-containing protein [Salmonella enterica subsp. enterica serovar Worthington]|nr:DUF465 domain-containing protein [Salmonella enterica subsp. enterica serovar Muenchen]EBV7251986.1 DUF465 domain-containing protein [Salmonella enterica subsp. enterica serovar Pomona]ECF3886180.1 DUF465 domain-containing protein [Salmonella enterica subsp. enterica serovar Ank]EGI5052557.1 DUF465 domain-containing protein [Salmonella enterica subsp. enterica serovar Worthington]QGR34815.1 DUF465 domain-containing protein [Salmonella enterica]